MAARCHFTQNQRRIRSLHARRATRRNLAYYAPPVKVRSLKSSDIPILQQYAERSGFEYPEPNDVNIEKILVVADDEDKPILAVAGKRLIEVFGWFSPNAGAELRNEAIEAIMEPMAEALRLLGYGCAETFLHPKLERRGFGRILTERFGFYRNWPSFGRRL